MGYCIRGEIKLLVCAGMEEFPAKRDGVDCGEGGRKVRSGNAQEM